MAAAHSLLIPSNPDRQSSRAKKSRTLTMELPERFQDDDEEDEDEEIAGRPNETRPEAMIQQSMYGVIAAAHSRGAVRASFHLDSGSDTETEGDGSRRNSRDISQSVRQALTSDERQKPRSKPGSTRPRAQNTSESAVLPPGSQHSPDPSGKQPQDLMTQSQILPGRVAAATKSTRPLSAGRHQIPILDRKIQAMARADMNSPASSTVLREKGRSSGSSSPKPPVALPEALAEIFQFPEREEVIAEYACWYLQSVLLQGYMYITQKHVCYYAYLQKKGNVTKSGYLSKQGKHNPRYKRYWFSLKGDVLSYYRDPNDPYFPSGAIDLRFSISAELRASETGQDPSTVSTFSITTDKRTFHFQAESASSAKEWVRQLQKVIFRSHNDGDSVKISLPLESIVDVEPTSLVDAANTIQLRAVDNNTEYALDEYFFTFFNHGEDALSVLKLMTRDNEVRNEDVSPPAQATGSTANLHPGSGNLSTDSGLTDEQLDPSASQILSEPTLRKSRSKQPPPASSTDVSTSSGLGPSSTGVSQYPEASSGKTKTSSTSAEPTRMSSGGDGSQLLGGDKAQTNVLPSWTSTLPLRNLSSRLQNASTLAGSVRSQGKKVSSYLSSSPRDYYDRFSGAIAGGTRHYPESSNSTGREQAEDDDANLDTAEHERRFQAHFSLPETEKLRAVFYCWLHRVLPLYGKIYVSDRRFCFRSLLYGTRTKLVVPFRDIDNVRKEKGFRWGYPGMVLVIGGHEELFFDFGSQGVCDDCVITMLRSLDRTKATLESIILTEEEKLDAQEAAAENELLQDARKDVTTRSERKTAEEPDVEFSEDSPILFDDPNASMLDFRPKKPLRITCLTIGSRGDVQPYIALCKGLLAHGHKVKIATHVTFKEWVEKHGIEFAPVEGDPAELMRLCVELGMFTPSFIYETGSFARGWLDKLLETAWKACQNSDLLIESPSAMAGIHIAEALRIPYFRAFTMPWTKTRAFPHAFATTNERMGGRYNYMTYIVFENVFWQMTAGQINRWRRKTLKIGPTDLGKMQLNKVPFLYNFSPSLVVPPLDFSDWIRITGYWFLEEAGEWTPPDDLVAFINKARADNMKLVYIGFGSIPMSDSKAMTQQIVEAVHKADVRCIFSKGWSDHFDSKTDSTTAPATLPSTIFQIRSAPHDWLFKQIDCAVHHGGSGTTGASLRAGVPTVIKPFFGDQFFFAARVEDRGVGIHLKKITAYNLGKAIWIACHDERMRIKARELGEKIRQEDGVERAINALYRDLEYAKTLIKKKEGGSAVEKAVDELTQADDEDAEESWTFVEDEQDVDVTGSRRASAAAAAAALSTTANRPFGLGYKVLQGRWT